MTAILKKWLTVRLDVTFKWKPEDFGNAVRDGVIISQLLMSYNVITAKEKETIIHSNDAIQIKSNLLIIKEWLKDINIDLNSNDIDSLVEGTGSVALRLFYQIFLELDGKDSLYFIRKRMIEALTDEEAHDFQRRISQVQSSLSANNLITAKNDFQFARDILEKRKSDVQFIDSKTSINQSQKRNEKKSVCETLNYTYEELKTLEEKAKQNMKDGKLVDKDRVNQYKEKIKSTKKQKKLPGCEIEMENTILDKMLQQCKIKEDEKKNVKMLLHLAAQEKKMAERLLIAKHEMTLIKQNRIKEQEERNKIREIEFDKALDDLKLQIKRKAKQMELEKEIIILFELKLNTKEISEMFCETYKLCKDTVHALLHFVYKLIEFKEMSPDALTEIPLVYLHNWKTMFIHEDVDKMSTDTEDIEQVKEVERLILDEEEFINYHDQTATWEVDLTYGDDDPCQGLETQGSNILSCILQKVLSSKYPTPKYLRPDPLPPKKVVTILLNASDISINSMFVDLLLERNTLIVHMHTAIEYCLEEYKRELIEFDELTVEFEQFEISLKNSDNDEIHQIPNSIESELTIEATENANKHTQTPNKMPMQDKYSVPAQLGNAAYECLNGGDCISDDLMASIIIEFLRNNQNFDGWVLIDYPKTFTQAKILEEKISGQVIDLQSEEYKNIDVMSNEDSIKKSSTEISKSFQSRIIPKPKDTKKNEEFQTYFTAFLKLRQSICIANEDCIWKLTEENSTLIERFYADQGINYSIYFERFDETTIQFIVEYVTGETTSYAKISQSISISNEDSSLGDNSKIILMKNERMKSASLTILGSLSQTISNTPIGTLTKNSKDNELEEAKSFGEYSDHNTHDKEELQSSSKSASNYLEEQIPVCLELSLPENILVILASFWETNETTYINILKELFCNKRAMFAELVPYLTHIRENLTYPTQYSSTFLDIIRDLHKELNSIDETIRSNSVVKSEMYSKNSEMQSELTRFAEIKRSDCENRIHTLIKKDWLTVRMVHLTNCFVLLMQAELNRSQETLRMLSDYYNTFFDKEMNNEELKAYSLLKLFYSEKKNAVIDAKFDDKSKTELLRRESNVLSTTVQDALMNCTELSNEENPFTNFLTSTKVSAESYITSLHSFHKTLIDKEKKPSKDAKSKKETKSAVSTPKDKTASVENINIQSVAVTNADVIVEWESVLNGEICRCKRRFNIIYLKALDLLAQYEKFTVKAFCDSRSVAEQKNTNEVQKIHLLYSLFNLAIEKEYAIPNELCFESEDFEEHVQISWNLILEKDELRHTKKCDFPIGELAKLQHKLMTVSKTCSIPIKAFVMMLQDFFLLNMNTKCLLPDSTFDWNHLEPEDFIIIVKRVYGNIRFVDWRDFLILCLDIPFPDQFQLLTLRNIFLEFDDEHSETIEREDFYKIHLWFEPEDGSEDNRFKLRSCLVKEFLFLLFEVDEDILNYSAFLLAFCRMENPEGGLMKGLSLALGKSICQDFEKCELYAQEWLQVMTLINEEHQGAITYAENIVTSMVDHTIRICSDVNISDIISPKSSSECFNKKYIGIEETKNTKPRKLAKISSSNITLGSEQKSSSHSSKRRSKSNVSNVTVSSQKVTESVNFSDEVYLISEEVVKRVLLASLPWNCRIEFAEPYADVVTGLSHTFTELKNDTNKDCVFIHRLLQHQFIKSFLHTIHKFKLSKPCQLATEILLDRVNTF